MHSVRGFRNTGRAALLKRSSGKRRHLHTVHGDLHSISSPRNECPVLQSGSFFSSVLFATGYPLFYGQSYGERADGFRYSARLRRVFRPDGFVDGAQTGENFNGGLMSFLSEEAKYRRRFLTKENR